MKIFQLFYFSGEGGHRQFEEYFTSEKKAKNRAEKLYITTKKAYNGVEVNKKDLKWTENKHANKTSSLFLDHVDLGNFYIHTIKVN